MDVERALDCDIDMLEELRLAYLQEDCGQFDTDVATGIRDKLPDYFKRHLNKDMLCHIVRENNAIVSCAFLLIIEKPMSPVFPNGLTGTVLNVYTCPAYRRKGYAKQVQGALLADARHLGLSTVDLKSTDAGYALYRAAGFVDDVSKYHRMKWKD